MRLSESDRGFLLGVLYSAWSLNQRGEDYYAVEMVVNAGNSGTMQKLARKEQYRFRRGFWSEVKRTERF